MNRFASSEDFEACRQLHRRFGTTYYFATQRLPRAMRDSVHAVYGFVRVPDEWVDNPGSLSLLERSELLSDWRQQLLEGLAGVRPVHPVMRAFVDVALASSIPVSEPEVFLDAMVRDLSQTRYPTYESLRGYMRGSAAAVGLMMAHVFGVERTPASVEGAIALGEAMQMTNFLRDIGDDAQRGRIYLPQEDLDRFHVYEDEILSGTRSNNFRDLMAFEIDRTRTLYSKSDSAIANLPGEFRKGVRVARILYSRILDRIERNDFDVFATRVRTSRMEKLSVAAKVFSGLA